MRRTAYWSGMLLLPVIVVCIVCSVGPPSDLSVSEAGALLSPNIILTEYSDFACPACAKAAVLLKEMREEFPRRIQVEFRHKPLQRIHPNATAAAQAAEAARAQQQFWAMHDLLFDRQKEWSGKPASEARRKFVEYAESLGLNTDRFVRDMDSPALASRIGEDLERARRLRVAGTPTFFINGERFAHLPSKLKAIRSQLRKEAGDGRES